MKLLQPRNQLSMIPVRSFIPGCSQRHRHCRDEVALLMGSTRVPCQRFKHEAGFGSASSIFWHLCEGDELLTFLTGSPSAPKKPSSSFNRTLVQGLVQVSLVQGQNQPPWFHFGRTCKALVKKLHVLTQLLFGTRSQQKCRVWLPHWK